MFRKYLLLVLSAVFLFAATPKDTIVIGVENEPERINPVFSEDHDAAIGLIFSGLVHFDQNMQAQPDLAKSWSISKDGLSYEFELRNDILWHDGIKFSAKDVQFTLQTLIDPKLNAPTKANFENIKKIELINDYKIKITLSQPFPALLDALSLGILPAHLLEGKDINLDKFNQNPIGTGPFKLKQWKKGQFMILEANENFYLGKVQSKKLILKHQPDPNVSAIELKAGNLDVALASFELVKDFQNDKNFKVLIEKSADYRALMFNFKNEILKDKAVRLALNYAVDRKAVVEKLLHSLGSEAYQPLQISWASPLKYQKFDYDLAKASQILTQAGYKKNSKGILEKNGKTLSFEIYTMSNDPLRVALINLLVSEFKKLGIEAKGIAKPSGSFDYTKVDSFLVGWGSPYDPDFHTFRVFASEKINQNGWNFGHYSNEKVDKALIKARTSLDKNERQKAYAEFINAIHDDPPYIFIAYLKFALVYNKNISGIKPYVLGHHGVGFTLNAWQWQKK
ncbi:peptide ABC transporter substrate-binding protein [Campylobacter sp. MIT 12-8780]|uniref:ABC transporter substrate-binding protein n=1 Tax=unclassified Campylobacter TaxID=2593542 RepID=UPI00115D39D9|nr:MULTISPECIES: ABC transporter substrate-binding protein [unclassified Campylobacter]NDJ27752.1 ABC transporter substrate-binding protein [Campylobacter sp. MIT 19-121]TQR41041.1 peptide ABC transporter substrate-binding protein [Campylobacter sp. MIT 12-8780]